VIRTASPADVPVILRLIAELATYERQPDAARATEQDLHDALFGADPAAGCHVAELDGQVVGFALWYRTFSTWTGRPGLWLEDLFVLPEARGAGLGRGLLVELARVAVARRWTRFEWQVLDWNEPAHGFYRTLGARPEDDWTVWRVAGDELHALAARTDRPPADPPAPA
jgi:GNAT superfamily N-acetyltransferase